MRETFHLLCKKPNHTYLKDAFFEDILESSRLVDDATEKYRATRAKKSHQITSSVFQFHLSKVNGI